MKKGRVGLFLGLVLLFVFAVPVVAESSRGLTDEEIAFGIEAQGTITQIDEGRVIDELRVSRDGRWIITTEFSQSTKNNFIQMISADGKVRKKLEAPFGYKNTPAFWGGYKTQDGVYRPLSVFMTFASTGSGSYADGIYFCSLEESKIDWKLWEKGNFRDLEISPNEDFLMASSGKWNSPTVRSRVVIRRLDRNGAKLDAGYELAPELKGQVHRIVMTPDTRNVIFECTVDKPGSYYGVSNIYIAGNEPNAPAELWLRNAGQPAISPAGAGYVLYFKRGQEAILEYDPQTQMERTFVSLRGVYPNALSIDGANGRLLLGVQISSSTAGLMAIPLAK